MRTGILLVGDYRHRKVDYQGGDFLFDIEVSGQMPGLMFRFWFGMDGLILCNH